MKRLLTRSFPTFPFSPFNLLTLFPFDLFLSFMELLIPGLILVALMVYASTRIKKTVATAFEAETVETDGFVIEKPEGFLNVINGRPELEFEAYSREFGGEGAPEVKQARVEIRLFENSNLDEAVTRIGETAQVVSNTPEIIDERKYLLIDAEKVENGIALREFYKLVEKGSGVYELKIIALAETNGDISRKIEMMLASFLVK